MDKVSTFRPYLREICGDRSKATTHSVSVQCYNTLQCPTAFEVRADFLQQDGSSERHKCKSIQRPFEESKKSLYSFTSHLSANYESWTSSPGEKSSNELDLWQKSCGMRVPAVPTHLSPLQGDLFSQRGRRSDKAGWR